MGVFTLTRSNDFLKEVLVRISLTALFIYTNHSEPFQRVILPQEAQELYRYPHTQSYVTGSDLLTICIAVPILTALITYYFNRDGNDFMMAILTFSLILPLNGFLVNIIKLTVGRPRPDFLSRCWPNGNIPWAEFNDSTSSQRLSCNGDPLAILEGRKSFPSGHSSMSFASFIFSFLYTAGKLRTFSFDDKSSGSKSIQSFSLLLAFSQIFAPLCIAISRTCDYHHHWQDVLIGSVIGSLISFVVYNHYFYSIFSERANLHRLSK